METEFDIYDFHENFKNTLVNNYDIKELSKKFMDMKKNSDKIKFSIELLEKCNLTSNFIIFNSKNNQKSNEFRKNGNDFFAMKDNKNYLKAIEYYNKSLCFAEENSENLGIAYANRSAIYYELNEYEKCLENIELARLNYYPERLSVKLDRRESNCNEKIHKKKSIVDTEDNDNIYKKLSFNVHNKVPFISDCLELEVDEQFGRYIKTTKDLKPGELIAIEESFCSFLVSSYSYQRCAYCLNENCYSLIPCVKCTRTMYCNQECYQNALNKFHRLECTAIDGLHKLFNKIHLNALRVVTYLYSKPEILGEVKKFIDKLNGTESNINAFTINYMDNNLLEKYKPIHTLMTNQEKRSVSDLFERSTIAAMLFFFLSKNPILTEIFKTLEYEDLFLELIFRHLQTSPTNMHSLSLIEDMISTDLTFASGAYAFCSMINHSCAPNLFRLNFGSKLAIFVMRPIKKGGQLYDNYGFHHCLLPRDKRIKQMGQYNFQCCCDACYYDYPLFNDLDHPLEVPSIITPDETHHITKYNQIKAKENIQKYCQFLLKYDEFYPCNQISEVQETLKISLNIVVGNVPYKYLKK